MESKTHFVFVKSKLEGRAEKGQEMQNFLDVYRVLVSNIKYTYVFMKLFFFFHTQNFKAPLRRILQKCCQRKVFRIVVNILKELQSTTLYLYKVVNFFTGAF